ncbi:MAG: hypothetical protein GY822_17370 [Deltaproteobacteria bacterium]|nr:hypothetical protein [Deltaproteobacteria bacterium]
MCNGIVFAGCHDTGEDTHFVFDVDVAAPFVRILQLRGDGSISREQMWPTACGPPTGFRSQRWAGVLF